MGMKTCGLISTVLLIILNIFSMICGFFLCYIAVWFITDANTVYNSIDSGPRFFLILMREKMPISVGSYLLFVGIVSAGISTIPLYGIVFRNQNAVKSYAVIMALVILLHAITVAVVLLAYIGESGQKRLVESVKKNYLSWHHPNFHTILFDFIFILAECCGISGIRDFNLPNLGHKNNHTLIPWSCCPMKNKWKLKQVDEECPAAGSENGLRPCYPILVSSKYLGEKLFWYFGFAAVPILGLILAILSLREQENRRRFWLFGQFINRASREICTTNYGNEIESYYKMADKKKENMQKRDDMKSISSGCLDQVVSMENTTAIVHSDYVISQCSYKRGFNLARASDNLRVHKENKRSLTNKSNSNDSNNSNPLPSCSKSDEVEILDRRFEEKNRKTSFFERLRKRKHSTTSKNKLKSIVICGSSETLKTVRNNKHNLHKKIVAPVKFEECRNCSCGKDCSCKRNRRERIKSVLARKFSNNSRRSCNLRGKQTRFGFDRKETFFSEMKWNEPKNILSTKEECISIPHTKKIPPSKMLHKDYLIFSQKSRFCICGGKKDSVKGGEMENTKFEGESHKRDVDKKVTSRKASPGRKNLEEKRTNKQNISPKNKQSNKKNVSPQRSRVGKNRVDGKGKQSKSRSPSPVKSPDSKTKNDQSSKKDGSPEKLTLCECNKESYSKNNSGRASKNNGSKEQEKPTKTSKKDISPERSSSNVRGKTGKTSKKDVSPERSSSNIQGKTNKAPEKSVSPERSSSRKQSPNKHAPAKSPTCICPRNFPSEQNTTKTTKSPKKEASYAFAKCMCPKNSDSPIRGKEDNKRKHSSKKRSSSTDVSKKSSLCVCDKNSSMKNELDSSKSNRNGKKERLEELTRSDSSSDSNEAEEDNANNDKGVQVSYTPEKKNLFKSFFSRFCKKQPREKSQTDIKKSNDSMNNIRICLCSKKEKTSPNRSSVDKGLKRPESYDSCQCYPEYPNKLVGSDTELRKEDVERMKVDDSPSYVIHANKPRLSIFLDVSESLDCSQCFPENAKIIIGSNAARQEDTKTVHLEGGPSYVIHARDPELYTSGENDMKREADVEFIKPFVPNIDLTVTSETMLIPEVQNKSVNTLPQGKSKMVSTEDFDDFCTCDRNWCYSSTIIEDSPENKIFNENDIFFESNKTCTEVKVEPNSETRLEDDILYAQMQKPVEGSNETQSFIKEFESCESNFPNEKSDTEIKVEHNSKFEVEDDSNKTLKSSSSYEILLAANDNKYCYSNNFNNNDKEMFVPCKEILSLSAFPVESESFNQIKSMQNQYSVSKYYVKKGIRLSDKGVGDFSHIPDKRSNDRDTATNTENGKFKNIPSIYIESSEFSQNLYTKSSCFRSIIDIGITRCSDCGLAKENVPS